MTHTRESIISLVMECLNWPKARATSWYTQENRWFNTNSPRELVQRGEGQIVVSFLEARRLIRESKESNE